MTKKKIKILILEDFPLDAELMSREIRKASIPCDIQIVDSKDTYLKALKELAPDMILSDHSLPHFSSVEALKLSIARCGRTPFILVTGTMSEEFAVEVMKEGAWDYVPKSQLQRLPHAILKAMDKFRDEKLRQKFLYDAILNEAYMEEAERIGNYGSWELDVRNRKLKLSKEALNILGYLRGEDAVAYENILKIGHPEELHHISQVIRHVLNTPDLEAYKDNFRLMDKDGQVRMVKTACSIKYNSSGELLRINGFIQNVTDCRSLEERLLESEERFRCLSENIEDTAIFVLTVGGHIVSANRSANIMFGFSGNEINNKHISLVFEEQVANNELLHHLALTTSPERLETKSCFSGASGSKLWVNVTVNALNNDTGVRNGFILMVVQKSAEVLSNHLTR